MRVTEVRIKLVDDNTQQGNDRLRAFCSITIDNAFVVRDLRLIEGANGLFVAMPSRKLTDRCPKCRQKNPLTARYCAYCGIRLPERPLPRDEEGRLRLHQDVAHPVNQRCREMIQRAVIEAFHRELERSREPGYRCTYDDADDIPGPPRGQTMSPGAPGPGLGDRSEIPRTPGSV